MTMKKTTVLVLSVLVSAANCLAALDVENGAGAYTITSTSAYIGASVVSTGSVNPYLFGYWGTNNASTNAGSWGFTNSYGQKTQGTYSVWVSNLAPATLYFYRARGTSPTEVVWASLSGSFRTLSSPTSAPPATTLTVTVDTNGLVKSPSNFLSANFLSIQYATLTAESPTNNMPIFCKQPFAATTSLLVETEFAAMGLTGYVSVLRRDRNAGRGTYTTILTNLVFSATPTIDTTTRPLTNGQYLGFSLSGVSAFLDPTNVFEINFKVQR